jgi:integrase
MIPPRTHNGPAAQERPGPGTERSTFDAAGTLLGEAFEMSDFAPIDGHPGFFRRRGLVYFRFRDQRNRRRWASAPTIRAAERLKAERETDVRRGDYRERGRETFASYAASWIVTYAGRTRRGVSETTRADYRRRLEQEAIPFFGAMRLSEIEPRDLREYATALEQRGLAPNTVRLAVAPVRALLATALEDGLLRSNPAAGLRLAQRRPDLDGDEDEQEQVKAMSEEQLKRLLATITETAERWWLFFAVLAWSGLRIGELVELRWRDVDLGQRTVHVRRRYHAGRVGPPKSRYGQRRLRLTPELARALWRLRAESGAGDDELVFTVPGGARVDASNLMSRVLKPAAVEAGLGEWVRDGRKLRAESWVGFHTFRHTCATVLFLRGWNSVQVQRWLGHHKPSFTLDTYVHLLPGDVPEPTFFDALAGVGDHRGDQSGDHKPPKAAEVAEAAQAATALLSTGNAS